MQRVQLLGEVLPAIDDLDRPARKAGEVEEGGNREGLGAEELVVPGRRHRALTRENSRPARRASTANRHPARPASSELIDVGSPTRNSNRSPSWSSLRPVDQNPREWSAPSGSVVRTTKSMSFVARARSCQRNSRAIPPLSDPAAGPRLEPGGRGAVRRPPAAAADRPVTAVSRARFISRASRAWRNAAGESYITPSRASFRRARSMRRAVRGPNSSAPRSSSSRRGHSAGPGLFDGGGEVSLLQVAASDVEQRPQGRGHA